ncbi:MAG: hypothetical protein H7Z19_07400 [Chitinophagaceae bacterium]|nr:hypothetical protein [Rubrivivax sp.]
MQNHLIRPALLLVVLAMLACSGCAKLAANLLGEPTPYQPFNSSSWNARKYGGFSEVQLGSGVFRVSFAGDGFTPINVATDMALLRSAELTLQQGCTHFAVIGGADHVQVSHGVTPSTTSVTGYQQLGNTLYATTTTRPGTTTSLSLPTATNTVVMYRERPASSATLVLDARDIVQQLTRKYGITLQRQAG